MFTDHQWGLVAFTHSPEANFTLNAHNIYPWYKFENNWFKIPQRLWLCEFDHQSSSSSETLSQKEPRKNNSIVYCPFLIRNHRDWTCHFTSQQQLISNELVTPYQYHIIYGDDIFICRSFLIIIIVGPKWTCHAISYHITFIHDIFICRSFHITITASLKWSCQTILISCNIYRWYIYLKIKSIRLVQWQIRGT